MEPFMQQSWVIWGVVSVIFFMAEIFIPGFWIAMFGVGAMMSALVALFSHSLNLQLIVFAFTTAVTLIFFRPIVFRYFYKNEEKLATNTDALVGKEVYSTEEINNKQSKGRVKIGGDIWRARSADDTTIAKDSLVRVVEIEGAKVIVEKIEEK